MWNTRPLNPRTLVLLAVILFPGKRLLGVPPNRETNEGHCFSLHVYKDEETVAGPSTVTLHSKSNRWNVTPDKGQFCLSDEMRSSESLDLSFQLEKDQFYLFSIPSAKFNGSWNLFFGGKRFAYQHGLPKSATPAKSCVVQFNDGEPGTEDLITPCRSKSK